MNKANPVPPGQVGKHSLASKDAFATGGATAAWRWLTCFVLVVSVVYLSLRASPSMQEISWLPRELAGWADRHAHLRHAVGFVLVSMFALSLLGARGRGSSHRKIPDFLRSDSPILAALCLLVAVLELAQLFLPRRSCDWEDILAGMCGIGIGWICSFFARCLSNPGQDGDGA